MFTITKKISLLLFPVWLWIAGCDTEIPNNGDVPDPELGNEIHEEKSAQD